MNTQSMTAEDVRKAWKDVLNGAEHKGQTTFITRWRKRSAVIVSPEWYERALALMEAADDHQRHAA